MNKYAILSVTSIFVLACSAVSNFPPSTSSAPEVSAPSLPETFTSLPVDADSLVGRNPSEWFPASDSFSALNNIPFQGYEAYVNEDYVGLFFDPINKKEQWQKELDFHNGTGRIVNYAYYWYTPECNTKSDAPSAQIVATIYKDAKGAQAGLESYSNLYDTPTNPKREVEVGDIGYTAFFLTPTCGNSAWTAFVYFRRNNIFGVAGVTTFKLEANFEKLELALVLAQKLDQIILEEMTNHSGTSEDLAALEKSAKTIDISSSPPQNPPPGSGDPTDFISPNLACAGGYGPNATYDVYGTVENTSPSPIMLTIEWGADDSGAVYFSDVQASMITKTVKISQNYTSTIEIEGDTLILDSSGFPYGECKIYSIKANWVE